MIILVNIIRKRNKIMKPVIVIGAGGHARVLADCLRLNNVNIIWCTGQVPPPRTGWVNYP